MFPTEPGADRDKLGFAEAVLDHFGFLTEGYGFSCITREPTYVRYESPTVFVSVYHERASYEVGIEVGLLPTPGAPARMASLAELTEYFGVDPSELMRCQYTTFAGVEKYISQLSEFLRGHGRQVLEGNPTAFECMYGIGSRLAEEHRRDMELARARTKAASAWRSKDYAEVVKSFEPLREYLSPVELAKLEYSKHRGNH